MPHKRGVSHNYGAGFIDKAKYLLFHQERKGLLRILGELGFLAVKQRELPRHYFSCRLYERGRIHIQEYLTFKEKDQIHRSARQESALEILDNKLLFHHFFHDTNVPLPRLLGYNLRSMFFIGKVKSIVKDLGQLEEQLVSASREADGAGLFIKKISGSGGFGAARLPGASDEKALRRRIRELKMELLADNHLIEAALEQHEALSQIYRNSINTMRIETFFEPSEGPTVIAASLRIGSGGRDVDNMSRGGMIIGIHPQEGTLLEKAFTFHKHGGCAYRQHPDTKVILQGRVVPCFKQCLDLAKAAALLLGTSLVGWDVAVTPDGPVLIEGNACTTLDIPQLTRGGLRPHPAIQQLLRKVGN